jgi:hypothetical protein
VRWGKLVVVTSTAMCWGTGIIASDDDFGFTATNVLIHGAPYLAVVWLSRSPVNRLETAGLPRRLARFVFAVCALAYAEELLWDRLHWHERGLIFPGPEVRVAPRLEAWLVPLLALPQATHYLLDAFIWRGKLRPAWLGRRPLAVEARRLRP